MSENKYFVLGPDPIAAIKSIGFTREMTGFARGTYEHETLPLTVRCVGSQEGWVCVLHGETVVLEPESFIELVSFVFQSMKMRGAK